MMKKLIPAVIAVVALGAVYKFVIAKPGDATAKPKPKVTGTIYVLGKEFLVNLTDGRFAKLTVALVLDPKDTSAPVAAEGAAKPPDGFGNMTEEAAVRDVITNELTNDKDTDLIDRDGRQATKERILADLKKSTDVKVDDILFTDVTVQ
jgi:flagellar basal body-associated protein FliL